MRTIIGGMYLHLQILMILIKERLWKRRKVKWNSRKTWRKNRVIKIKGHREKIEWMKSRQRKKSGRSEMRSKQRIVEVWENKREWEYYEWRKNRTGWEKTERKKESETWKTTRILPIEITRRLKLRFSYRRSQLKYRYDSNIKFNKNGMISVENFLGYNILKALGKLSRNNRGIAHERRKGRIQFWNKVISNREYTQNEKKWNTLKNLNSRAWFLSENVK